MFDDFWKRAEEAAKGIGGDIGDYLKNRVVDPLVKIGEPQKGNQTSEQIAEGQYGGTPGLAVVAQAGSALMPFLPLIAVGALVYFIAKKG